MKTTFKLQYTVFFNRMSLTACKVVKASSLNEAKQVVSDHVKNTHQTSNFNITQK